MKRVITVGLTLAAWVPAGVAQTTDPATSVPPAAPAVPIAAPPPPPDQTPTVVKPAASALAPAISGYLQLQYTNPDDGNGDGAVTPDAGSIRRLRLRVKGGLAHRIGYAVMIDPSTSANMLRDAYAAITALRYHEIRLGQQKTQFGYENPESSARLLTVNRAAVSDALGRGSDLRDIGIGVLASIPAGRGIAIEYAVTLVNGAGPNTTRDDTEDKSVWGRAGAVFKHKPTGISVRAGVSGARGDRLDKGALPDASDDREVRFLRIGGDVELDSRWLFLAAEVIAGRDEAAATIDARGFYVLAIGRTPWHTGPIVRYDELDPDTATRGDRSRRVTLGAYYDVASVDTRFIVNYELDRSQKEKDSALHVFGQIVF